MKHKGKLVALGNCFGAPAIYKDMFTVLVTVTNFKELSVIEKDDVVLYGGGEDISPSMYGESFSRFSYADKMTRRDYLEQAAFRRALRKGAANFGICRGAQLVCALSGGKLVMHINGHTGGGHIIVDRDTKKKYVTSSVHHQMMWPFDMLQSKFEVLAATEENHSDVYAFNDKDVRFSIPYKEPEIVWFPETKSLGIQGHPEFMNSTAPLIKYSKDLLAKYL